MKNDVLRFGYEQLGILWRRSTAVGKPGSWKGGWVGAGGWRGLYSRTCLLGAWTA